MTGIASEDWPPLVAASLVLVLGNVVGFLNGWTVHLTILFAPLAVVAFGVVRYALHGSPLPDALRDT
ncbi:hypothetical protein [Natronomonas marina]|jgi:ABC-type xylose transport system permease subunit|uniref:hypothetical protein n=1 Tax=Natronomonas marina TaxID=2961939 RepID=UPI0020C965BC|nr:hypothetical protein [Natronomonas marina]